VASSRTLPEELFGVVWARRLRVGAPAAAPLLLVTGCAVFHGQPVDGPFYGDTPPYGD
jgi:hypothetical protein